jgi:putative transposase
MNVTAPRQIEPDSTFFVTVRAISRSYRFVPEKKVRESLDFALEATAAKFEGKIELHEYQLLSNHYHLLGTDKKGLLPEFMREFHSVAAPQLNSIRGISGSNVEKDYNLCVVDMITGRNALQHAVYIRASGYGRSNGRARRRR